MKTFDYTITDPDGLHARPAGIFVKEAGRFQSDIKLAKEGKEADAKRLFAVMSLGVKGGDTITVTISGADEAVAESILKTFLTEHL